MLLGGGVAYGLKQLIHEERPDHSDRKSFPSAHTAEAFAAAATPENRYGWEAGLPALAVATLVGVARVEARKHHWYDAVAGAAIGAGSGFLLTSARNGTVRLVPWADAGGGGLALAAIGRHQINRLPIGTRASECPDHALSKGHKMGLFSRPAMAEALRLAGRRRASSSAL